MPGLTLYMIAAPTEEGMAAFSNAQARMVHSSQYCAQVHASRAGIAIGHVAYPRYPVQYLDTDSFDIAFEGRIYNHSESATTKSLVVLIEQCFANGASRERLVRSWMMDHDGEYLVVAMRPQSREILIFNDPLGRLPFAYSANDREFIAGRECKFVAQMIGAGFDRVGWAEALWIGYPIGERTFFEHVYRFPAGSMLAAQVVNGRVRCDLQTLFQLNLDEKEESKPLASASTDLVDLFLAATQERGFHPQASTNVISLSGGLDSRAVAAAVKHIRAKAVAATFVTQSLRGARDALLAEKIASILQMPWHLIRVGDNDDNNHRRLVSMTDGYNSYNMAFILEFMDKIVERWGATACYMTGDGGDKLLPQISPNTRMTHEGQLLKWVDDQHGLMPLGSAEDILHLGRGTIKAEVCQLFSSMPETDLCQRAAHFTFYQRCHNWLFGGEDRARYFLWQTTPFYSLPFVRYAMCIPDRWKAHRSLSCAFQRKLSQPVASVPCATYRLPPSSWLFPWSVRSLELLLKVPRGLRRSILGVTRRSLWFGRQRRSFLQEVPKHSVMDAAAVRAMLISSNSRNIATWRTLALLESLW